MVLEHEHVPHVKISEEERIEQIPRVKNSEEKIEHLPSFKSLLPVHLLNRLHGLPLGKVSLRRGKSGLCRSKGITFNLKDGMYMKKEP